jgi:hypothetical protein
MHKDARRMRSGLVKITPQNSTKLITLLLYDYATQIPLLYNVGNNAYQGLE